jgi:hypothetical protein
LPDGLFSNQKYQFWKIFEGLPMENVGIFMSFGSISRPFGIFCGHLVYLKVIWYIFPRFGMLHQEKSGNPAEQSVTFSKWYRINERLNSFKT